MASVLPASFTGHFAPRHRSAAVHTQQMFAKPKFVESTDSAGTTTKRRHHPPEHLPCQDKGIMCAVAKKRDRSGLWVHSGSIDGFGDFPEQEPAPTVTDGQDREKSSDHRQGQARTPRDFGIFGDFGTLGALGFVRAPIASSNTRSSVSAHHPRSSEGSACHHDRHKMRAQ